MSTVERSNLLENTSKLTLGTLLRVLVTLAVFAYLSYKLDWYMFYQHLLQSRPLWLAGACLLFGSSFLVAALRWWLLLKVQNIYLPLSTVTILTLIGQFFNSFLLGATGGDAVRIFYILKHAPYAKTQAVLSIIVDRSLGLLLLLCVPLLGMLWLSEPLLQQQDMHWIMTGLAGVFVLMLAGLSFLVYFPVQRLPLWLQQLHGKIPQLQLLEKLLNACRSYAHASNREFMLMAVMCSIVIHLLVFTGGFALAQAIMLDVSFSQIMFILAIASCVTSLPISVGGHGIREGIFILLFSVFHVTHPETPVQEFAVLYSLLFFALLSVWSLLGGILYFMYQPDYAKA